MNIIYTEVTNKDWFLLSLKSVKKYLKNLDNIFVLKSNIDLSDIEDILVTNQSLYLFCSRLNIGQKILVIDLNVCLLQNINSLNIPITYEMKENKLIHDHIKPQILDVNKFLLLPNQEYIDPLTQYFKHISRVGLPNSTFTIHLTKPICCTVKSLLSVKRFVTFDLKSFLSLKKYLDKKILSLI